MTKTKTAAPVGGRVEVERKVIEAARAYVNAEFDNDRKEHWQLLVAVNELSALDAEDNKPRCKVGLYCGQAEGHEGECDDIPF